MHTRTYRHIRAVEISSVATNHSSLSITGICGLLNHAESHSENNKYGIVTVCEPQRAKRKYGKKTEVKDRY